MKGLFDPKEMGLRPVALHTACWRGYICSYSVTGARLYLQDLVLGLTEADRKRAADGSLLINGVKAEFPKEAGPSFPTFKNVKLPMKYTGGMLIGKDFIRELYVPMGFQAAYKYRDVRQLVFRDGQLVEAFDRSKEMAAARDAIEKIPRSEDPKVVNAKLRALMNKGLRLEY